MQSNIMQVFKLYLIFFYKYYGNKILYTVK